MANTFKTTLSDGTLVYVEDNGGDHLQLFVQKGQVVRGMGIVLEEAKALKRVLDAALLTNPRA